MLTAAAVALSLAFCLVLAPAALAAALARWPALLPNAQAATFALLRRRPAKVLLLICSDVGASAPVPAVTRLWQRGRTCRARVRELGQATASSRGRCTAGRSIEHACRENATMPLPFWAASCCCTACLALLAAAAGSVHA
jgi:hypothetical protein